jgi:hypothetical protein
MAPARELIEGLYRFHYSRDDSWNLLRFIDRILTAATPDEVFGPH